MSFFCFLVSWSGKYSEQLHNYHFITNSGFATGLLVAFVIALVMSALYYFVLGSSVTTAKTANWWICLIIACIACFSVSDFILIGREPSKKEYANAKNLDSKLTYKYSIYKSLDKALKPNKDGIVKGMTAKEKESIQTEKKKIAQKLNQGGDVRMMFDLNTTIWCAIFCLILTVPFKCMSPKAKTKPYKWPF